MQAVDGLLTILHRNHYYNLSLPGRGWLAVDMVQYLADLYRGTETRNAILKLLGWGLQVTDRPPGRPSGITWVVVDLERRVLETNSSLIRKAVDRTPAASDDPLPDFSLRRIHRVLDRYDFTVKLYDDPRR